MIELRILGPPALDGVESEQAAALLRQPKRLALLVRLALAGRDRFARRDELLAMLWPEHTEERGRHALRQALHGLRATLGKAAIVRRGDDELALDDTEIRCDAATLERLLDENRAAEALDLYRGDLLPGFHVDDAPEFARWLDDARARLRGRAARAAVRLAVDAEQAGSLDDAVRWARRACELAPDDENALRRRLMLLDRTGNRAAALQVYAQFSRRLAEDLDVEPSPETTQLAADLKRRDEGRGTRDEGAATRSMSAAPPPATPPSFARYEAPPRSSRTWIAGAIAVAGIVLTATMFMRPTGAPARAAPAPASVSTSPMARRLYEEGMRAFTAGDRDAAERLMRAAVEEDSTFGLAMLQLGHFMGLRGDHAEGQRVQTAAYDLAPRQPDHERLLILSLFADHFGDPRLRAFAETLAIRYPTDLEGQLLVAKARSDAGEFLAAVGPLRRVIAADTLPVAGPATECAACAAFGTLVGAYENADSLPAAERAARDWTRARPDSPDAWLTLMYQLAIQGRYAEATEAWRRAGDFARAGQTRSARDEILLRSGDFATLGQIIEMRLASADRAELGNGQLMHWRLLREQGRFGEALSFAEELWRSGPSNFARVLRTQSLNDAGRFAEVARIWDSLATHVRQGPEPASSFAALRAGYRVNQIHALAESGDTRRVAAAIAALDRDLAQTGSERTRRFGRHARGMLLLARGDAARACDTLRSAFFSATNSYVKTYLAAGRACLAANRPADAVVAMRGVLQGPLGASGTTATFTGAHELIAHAFTALGQRDSARVHYRRVAEAWANADEPMRSRAVQARALAAAGVSGVAAARERDR